MIIFDNLGFHFRKVILLHFVSVIYEQRLFKIITGCRRKFIADYIPVHIGAYKLSIYIFTRLWSIYIYMQDSAKISAKIIKKICKTSAMASGWNPCKNKKR